MAGTGGVRPMGNRIEVNLQWQGKRHVFTINLNPTKANLAAIARQRADVKVRLRSGESADYLIAEMKGENVGPAPKTLQYYAQHYLDVVAPESVADSTLMGYQSAYNSHWRPYGNLRVDQISISDLQRHLDNKKIIKKTRREALGVLKRIFDVAVADGVFDKNPLDGWSIKKSKRDEKPEPDPYSKPERDALLAELHQMGNTRKEDLIAYRYFLAAFFTGMRTGELLGLHWQDYQKPHFHVWRSMVRRKMQNYTKTEQRRVLLTNNVIDMLMDNPTRFRKAHVFLTPEGHMFRDGDWLMKRWDRAHAKAGVRKRVGPYPWRHTYISLSLVGGISINDVAQQVGNSPSIVEKHYAKWIPTEDDTTRLQNQLEGILS